ncbi:universal stress protein [Halodesulfovibrio marinisediminis]|uniref:Nucleotide-binding universal stress protein, UspA family n=1 Tax=Halodesulfovibrio marinisediminis DSM 17456 TaxID=1121457 RepID=A0A1N6I8F2_9BACT|nr:universal stress protein [Halodesulfovibrio marinisediminis]SIO28259.1 Nucleotide-binding universal stress protein, UspA family [Halodesulfovibrio marinisediminis DSM 17456]
MERHLLVAVGTHPSAASGLQFVSDFITSKDNIRLSLLTIYSAYNEGGPVSPTAHIAKKKGLAVLEEVRKALEEKGFEHKKIALRCTEMQGTRAHTLIHEINQGQFDAVVLGHRERILSLEDFLDTSVCTELLKASNKDHIPPFWLCRHLPENKKGVLLCTDGSDPSLRIADHVGNMMLEIPGHDVKVLHIADPTKEDLPDARSVVQKTVDKLTATGLDQSRISSKILERVGAAGVILEEAAQGNFAIVAMGTAGAGQKIFSKLFTGSVARKVFNELTNTVLWASF